VIGTTRSYACATQVGLPQVGSNVMRTARVMLPVCSRRATRVSLPPGRGAFTGRHTLQRCPQKPLTIARAQLGSWNTGREFYRQVGNFVGSVLSPLLANIALHGLEDVVQKAGGPVLRRKNGIRIYQNTLCIRYADDFVVFHKTWEGIQRCKETIQEWLKGMG